LLHTACCDSTTAPASNASPSRWPDPLARTSRVVEWPPRISSGCTAPFPMPLKRARCLVPSAWLVPKRLAPLSTHVFSDPTGPADKARWDYWERVAWPGPGLSPPHSACRLSEPACPCPGFLRLRCEYRISRCPRCNIRGCLPLQVYLHIKPIRLGNLQVALAGLVSCRFHNDGKLA